MAYLGRIVIVGNHEGNPFAGSVLQSRSDPERVVIPRGNSANVVPSKAKLLEVVTQLRQGDLSITHNTYPCVFGFDSKDSRKYVVACNGRFAGAIRRKIGRGSQLEEAIDTAFDASDPKLGDPRVVAVAQQLGESVRYFLGAFDVNKPRWWSSEVEVGRNVAKYVASNSEGEIRPMELMGIHGDKLAESLFTRILGVNPEFGIGAAACAIKGGKFEINVYPDNAQL